jgi:hypothetical protein
MVLRSILTHCNVTAANITTLSIEYILVKLYFVSNDTTLWTQQTRMKWASKDIKLRETLIMCTEFRRGNLFEAAILTDGFLGYLTMLF